MGTRIRKAVIPAAGLGTRFLPATKAIPKEMLPVVDKPAIQYVVEEAADAGLQDVLVIIGRNKNALANHFDSVPELEHNLSKKKDDKKLEHVKYASDLADVHFVRQGSRRASATPSRVPSATSATSPSPSSSATISSTPAIPSSPA